MDLRKRLRVLSGFVVIRRLAAEASGSVLLTFDDGPDPEVTPQVLDRLDQVGAKALFFIPGRRVSRAPDLVREILGRGHEIGNHTQDHPRGRAPGLIEGLLDARRCQQTLSNQGAPPPRFYRPSEGRLSLGTTLGVWPLGLRTMLWSQEVRDWSFTTEEQAIDGGRHLASRVQERDIVLLHDDNALVLPLLDMLLPELVRRHFDLAHGLAGF